MNPALFDFDEAVSYHYGKFPPEEFDIAQVVQPLLRATDALARYDQMLKGMHNSELFLAPLRDQEAVISSRMEGTLSTMDEILAYQMEYDDNQGAGEVRSEVIETVLYRRALNAAQHQIELGQPLGISLIKSIHAHLLSFGRGASKAPGRFKTEQNYIGERGSGAIGFVPINPVLLQEGMERLLAFLENDELPTLVRIAMAHLEFEALHPFLDGNGRVGRMLVTLMLWKMEVISAPHFYISRYLEDHKTEYIRLMREVSLTNNWGAWCTFFLTAIAKQAENNLQMTESIQTLYEEMKGQLTETLSSQWALATLDYLFTNPIFPNSHFTQNAGIPAPTAARFSRTLLEKGFLQTVRKAAGRRSAVYRFEPLMRLIRV